MCMDRRPSHVFRSFLRSENTRHDISAVERRILFVNQYPCTTFMEFGLQIEAFDSRFVGQDQVVLMDDEEKDAGTMPKMKT